ncbi:hypothetical protein GAZ87_12625, partial [Phocaeicola vulgatus]
DTIRFIVTVAIVVYKGLIPVVGRILTNLRISAIQFRKLEATFTESCNKIPGYITNKKLF